MNSNLLPAQEDAGLVSPHDIGVEGCIRRRILAACQIVYYKKQIKHI